MPLRLIFMGTPDFAVPTLTEIVRCGHEVVAVYTRAAKPAGRGMAPKPTPVEREARHFDLTVHTPTTLRTSEAATTFAAHDADAAVVVAYGLILPKPILDAVPLGCFNLHASLLPRWRGAAPINRAIMEGDAETGVTVMRMEEGLDTGPIVMERRIAILPDATAKEVHDELAQRGAELMARALAEIERGLHTYTLQPESGIIYATKLSNDETRIVWARTAREVHDHIRGLSPFPGAWFELPGKPPIRARVLRTTLAPGSGAPGTVLDDALTIACADGAVRILELQRAGKQAMPAADFLRGNPLPPGTRLT